MFKSTSNKGFQLIFSNGWKVSVQWGTENYCDNQHKGGWDAPMKVDVWTSRNAEVAIHSPDAYASGEIRVACSPDDVAAIIADVSSR